MAERYLFTINKLYTKKRGIYVNPNQILEEKNRLKF